MVRAPDHLVYTEVCVCGGSLKQLLQGGWFSASAGVQFSIHFKSADFSDGSGDLFQSLNHINRWDSLTRCPLTMCYTISLLRQVVEWAHPTGTQRPTLSSQWRRWSWADACGSQVAVCHIWHKSVCAEEVWEEKINTILKGIGVTPVQDLAKYR